MTVALYVLIAATRAFDLGTTMANSSHPHDLLSISTKHALRRPGELLESAWMSNHQILLQCVVGAGDRSLRVFRVLDVRTGQEADMSRGGAVLARRGLQLADRLQVSPDGRWIGGIGMIAKPDGSGMDVCFVISTGGWGYRQWPVRSGYDPVAWSADSKAVVGITIEHADEGVHVDWHPVVPWHGRNVWLRGAERHVVTQSTEICSLKGSQFMVTNDLLESRNKAVAAVRVARLTLAARPGPVPWRSVTLPYRAMVKRVRFSPNGRHIALLVKTASRASLCVASTGGGSAREIGRRTGPDKGPYEIAWRPDGRQIAFDYKNAIWTVDVPSGPGG